MKKLVSFILIAFVSAFAMAQETITFEAEMQYFFVSCQIDAAVSLHVW